MSITDWGKQYGITPSVLFDWLDGDGGPVPDKVSLPMSDKIKKKIQEQAVAVGFTP